MKKLLLLLIALTLGFGVKAQCPLSTAVDFTATDCHGTEVHLFDILDGGQYVLIDFFFTSCGPCQQATPKIVESYSAFGCNMYDVYYMEISDRDSDAACQNWCQNYGVEYPTIAGTAGGSGICNQYGIGYFPTVILIAPDHSIVINDLWPINNTQTVITALENQGVQQHDCTTPVTDIMPDFTAPDIDGNEIHLYDILDGGQAALLYFFLTGDEFSQTPMPDVTEAYQLYGCNAHDVFFMEITPNGHDDACQAWVEQFNVKFPTISRDGGGNDIAQAIPVGFYPTIMLVRPDHEIAMRDIYPPTLEQINSAMTGEGYGQFPCAEETLTFSVDTVNIVDNQYEINWITVYNNTAEDALVTSVCDQYEMLAFTLDGNSDFFCYDPIEIVIPQGESVELGFVCNIIAKNTILSDVVTLSSNLPDVSFVVMLEDVWSVDENGASTTLFPNPANERLTLKGERLDKVSVYNALGQKMDEFNTEGSELSINTTRYQSGVYFIKVNEKTLRFVVNH